MDTLKHRDFKLVLSLVTAAVLWFVMFSPLTSGMVDFWLTMACSALVLIFFSFYFGKRQIRSLFPRWSDIALGIIIAVFLWCVFWCGDKVAGFLFGFADSQIDMVYGIKGDTPGWVLTLLLLFLIGPEEEIFWRGYVQNILSDKWSPNIGFAVTTAIYALVHLPSGNFMLIMAALTAGAVWGFLYRLFPERLPSIILSHALWDVAVFIWFPI